MNEQEHKQFHLSAARAASRRLDEIAITPVLSRDDTNLDEDLIELAERSESCRTYRRMRDLHIDAAGKPVERCEFNHGESDEVTP